MRFKRASGDSIFQTDHLKKDLKRKAVRGGSVTVGSQGAKFLLRLLSTAILARFLTPEDYGLMGMTLVVSGLMGVMRDGGLVHATVQKERIDHQETSLLFWINIAIGLSVALALIATAPLVSLIFGDERLTSLLSVLSVTFLLGGCDVQHKALLRRNMRFTALALIDVISMLVGIVVAVVMAMRGWGYWALAWLEISKAATSLILSWSLLWWIPSLPKWHRSVLATLKFGGNIVIYNVVNFVSRNADNALIGWYWGAASLGLYTRAYSLLLLPVRNVNAPFSSVAIPVLSRAKHDMARLKRFFVEAASLVAAVVIPLVVCAAVFAEELVSIFLGEGWAETAALFRLLAVPALLFGASQPISWLYIVLDRTHLMRNVGLVSAPVNLIAFAIGLPFGPKGVAIGYMISSSLMYYPIVKYALGGTGITVGDVLKTWLQPILASVAGVAAGLAVKFLSGSVESSLLVSAGALVGFAIGYGCVMVFAFSWKERFLALFAKKGGNGGGIQGPATEPVS